MDPINNAYTYHPVPALARVNGITVPLDHYEGLLATLDELQAVKAERDAARAWAALWKRKATISRYSIRDLRENVTGLYGMWRKERLHVLDSDTALMKIRKLVDEALTPKKETT